MARPLRIEFAGAVYHVSARGDHRQAIFRDDEDRRRFLSILARTIALRKWLCHAYCLMGNHYHLLIETPEPGLSRGMRSLNGEYTQAFNWRHNRPGHVFQGRYKAVLVEKEKHLLELCRYVVLNPVRSRGMKVRSPESWAWSSYKATSGLSGVPGFLSVEWVLSRFGRNRPEAQARFRAFVEEGKRSDAASPERAARGGLILGTEHFQKSVMGQLKPEGLGAEFPRSHRQAVKLSLDELFIPGVRGDKEKRDAAILRAYRDLGYKLREIGDHLGMHYASISRIARGQG